MHAAHDPVAVLLAEIASCDSAFRLMELLMRFCRDQAAAYRAWDEPESHTRATAARAEAERVAGDEVGGIFSPDDPPEVVEPIRAAVAAYLRADNPPPVVRATFLLRALDEKLTFPLRAVYSDFRPGPLHPDQLFPVYWPDLRTNGWLPRNRLSTRPSRLSQPPEFLSHWGLAPPAAIFSGREVAFAFPERTDVTRPVPGPLKLGVALLNTAVDDLTWDTSAEPLRFSHVRPVRRDEQVRAMKQVATRAAEHGVRVLVFPELCIDRSGAEEVFQFVAGIPDRPFLVVVGGHHWRAGDGAPWRNICWAASPDSPPRQFEHTKLVPFTDERLGAEDIQRGTTVRIFVGTDWSLALLICRDFLDLPARQLVEALRPTVLCVPSFSLVSHPFIDPIGALTANAQTVVVFANGPAPKNGIAAVFGVPRTREPGAGTESLARQSQISEPLPAVPCLILYDGTSDQITHLPC